MYALTETVCYQLHNSFSRMWNKACLSIENSKSSRALSSGSSGRGLEGGQETWNLCGRIRRPSILWFIFTGPGGHGPSSPPPLRIRYWPFSGSCSAWLALLTCDIYSWLISTPPGVTQNSFVRGLFTPNDSFTGDGRHLWSLTDGQNGLQNHFCPST